MASRSAHRLLLGVLLIFALAAPSAADPLFSSASSFNTGLYPRSIAIADVDGDGHLDLVTANQAANTVSVLLGNGDGTFRARTDFEAGGRPLSVAVADLNADGRSDLAVAGEGYDPDYAGRVSVLLGNGDGTFGTRTQYGVPQWPQAVAVADMNGDRRPDLVVPSGNPTNKLSVLLNSGDGTFGPGTAFGTSDFPSSVAIADVDVDGQPDVVVTNLNSHSVSVFRGKGDGTLGVRTDFGTGASPWSVAIGDVNGDGELDLIVANFDSNTVSVILGNGDGTFGLRTDFSVGVNPRGVAVADVDGDGFLDIAAANDGLPDTPEPYPGSYFLTLLLGDGAGGFGQRADFDTGIHPWAVAIADLSSDGYPDLAVADTGSGTVSILLNGGAHFPVAVIEEGEPRQVAVAIRGANPTSGERLDVEFTLHDGGPAQLELMDVAGRVIASRPVGAMGSGRHSIHLAGGRAFSPGIYFLRLTQAGIEARTRVAVIR